MNGSTHPTRKHALLLSVLLGGVVLTNCKSVNTENRATSKRVEISNAASALKLSTSAQAKVDTFA